MTALAVTEDEADGFGQVIDHETGMTGGYPLIGAQRGGGGPGYLLPGSLSPDQQAGLEYRSGSSTRP
jgi:hypothetical protein